MKGSVWVKGVPEKDYLKRDEAIIAAVKDGNFVVDWSPLPVKVGNASCIFMVSADTLKIGEPGDAVRVCISHRAAQLVADELKCVLPTAKLSDEIWNQADLKLEPSPQSKWVADSTMGYTSRMVQFDTLINGQMAGKTYSIVAGHHKDWINTRLLGTLIGQPMMASTNNPLACNYGWHTRSAGPKGRAQTLPGVNVWQGPGTAHDYYHSDYSQLLRLVQRKVYVCTAEAVAGFGRTAEYGEAGSLCVLPGGSQGVTSVLDIYDMVNKGDEITKLVSGEGFLLLRHPAMGLQDPIDGVVGCPMSYPSGCITDSGGKDTGPVEGGPTKTQALVAMAIGGVAGFVLVRAIPKLVGSRR